MDYIPEDHNLCGNCIYWEKCPWDYVCPSLDRLIEFEQENEEI